MFLWSSFSMHSCLWTMAPLIKEGEYWNSYMILAILSSCNPSCPFALKYDNLYHISALLLHWLKHVDRLFCWLAKSCSLRWTALHLLSSMQVIISFVRFFLKESNAHMKAILSIQYGDDDVNGLKYLQNLHDQIQQKLHVYIESSSHSLMFPFQYLALKCRSEQLLYWAPLLCS